ncbi:MAG TPA: LAGLIDADG family homing endonuclease, partial [Conexivisphaerales archaeon]|nr:LAGLIDADG family homing endonuclease [Conexivisphaerales archaeon]
ARVVVDSAGSATKIRRNIPIDCKVEKDIDRDDLESTGRYVLDFERGVEDRTWFDPKYALIHFDQYLSPGGYCLAPGSPIVCKHSLKPIEEVAIGDEVLTMWGWMPVSDTSERQFSGELISIAPRMLNQEIRLTPDHLVRVWNREGGESWKRADELVRGTRNSRGKGDFLVIPLPKQGKEPKRVLDAGEFVHGITEGNRIFVAFNQSFFDGCAPGGVHRRKVALAKHPRKTSIPRQLQLNEDFMELCGWYVSEGCIKRRHVTISNTDVGLVKRIRDLVERLGYNYLTWTTRSAGRTKPCVNIEITNSLLGEVMSKNFGTGARSKELPNWVHDISEEAKRALLVGLYLGDGSIYPGRGGRSDKREYTTTSHALVMDLWLLLARLGVVGSIKKNKKKDAWSLTVSGHQAGFLGERLVKAARKQYHGFVLGDDRVYVAIKSLAKVPYSGPVYDLNSAGDFTSIFDVHNCWTFPRGESKANIGLGVQKSALDARNRRYGKKDTLQDLIDEYVRTNKAIRNPMPSTAPQDVGNNRGNWQVSVRRHNDCLVANGYALVGDAAWMARPVDAGGIGPCIYSSVILGRVLANALEAKDTSEEGLWSYNVDYMRFYGYQMASFEVLRAYLQTLSNEKISYGMKHFLSEEDVAHITRRQHPQFDRVRMFNPIMWLSILAQPSLAGNLRFTAKKSESLIAHNLNFPENPEGWAEWKKGLIREMNEAFRKFGVKELLTTTSA